MGRRVIMSRAYYEALIARIEDLEDARITREAIENRDLRDYLPIGLVERMLDGEHPIRIWRERRDFAPEYLAAKAGLSLRSLMLSRPAGRLVQSPRSQRSRSRSI